jgi:hypothetical protein
MDLRKALFHLHLDGWFVIEGVIPAAAVAGVRQSVEATVSRHHSDTAPAGIGFVPGLINVDQSFAPYLADARLLSLVEALLGEQFRISMTSAIVSFPGNGRGSLHADWPFNQKNAGHIRPPYPDAVMHLTTLWMLSDFTEQNGGTIVVPGTHRFGSNPTGDLPIDAEQPYPTELHVTGPAGSVIVMDSRLWHATPPNHTDCPRAALAVRYAPWWLNLDLLMPGSDERKRMVEEPGKSDNQVPPVPRRVYEALPEAVRPLYRHWVRD